MKCYNCKENVIKEDAVYKFAGHNYCYDCLIEYIDDECKCEAYEMWIQQNTRQMQ